MLLTGNKTHNVRITSHWGAFVQQLLQWEVNKCYTNSVCICSLRYPACNAHAPYCHLWPALLYNIVPHYLLNDTVFEKKLVNTKCVFWFSLQLLSETFVILRRSERDMVKNVYWCSCKAIPLQAWTGPEGSRRLRLPDFKTIGTWRW